MPLEKGANTLQTLPSGVTLLPIVDGPFNASRINSRLAVARKTDRDPRTTPLPLDRIDTSRLVTVTPRGKITELNLPLPSDIPLERSIEDPRYVQALDRPDEGVMGVTVAWTDKNGGFVWKPALIPVRVEGTILVPTAEPVVFDSIAKNITPIDYHAENGTVRFMVRHDDRGEKHDFTYYIYNFKTGKLEERNTTTMRTTNANGARSGATGGKPVHLNGQDIMIFHGQQPVTTPAGTETIAYSLFPAVIDIKRSKVVAIGEPFLTPDLTSNSPKLVAYSDDIPTARRGWGGKPEVVMLASMNDGNIVKVTVPAEVITDSLRRIRRP